jgi:DNA invertase Pin-like site-specific DNA recombinase
MVHDIDTARSKPVQAGVYERVSKLANAKDRREVQRARSIEEQNKANREECERHGWTITDRYADSGLSASRFATKDRPEYKRLLADVEAGKLDVVVLWESSRGGRELAAWAQFLNACGATQTGIYITTHGRLYDMANGRDWRSLAEDGVDSGYESEKTSMRIRRHVAATMLAGAPFGHCPYGYEREYDPKTRELIKAAPWGRSRRRHGALAVALAGAPVRPGLMPVGWRGEVKFGPPEVRQFHRCRTGRPCSRCRIVRGRSEPVKAVCGRRPTAAVELPGERTREDGLDRTCPDQEMAAIGSRDTSGQGLDA